MNNDPSVIRIGSTVLYNVRRNKIVAAHPPGAGGGVEVEASGSGDLPFAPAIAPMGGMLNGTSVKAQEPDEAGYLFVTSADKYHLPECPFAKTGIPLTIPELLAREATPCGRCNPPALS